MKRKLIYALPLLMCAAAVLTSLLVGGSARAAEKNVIRLGGKTRVETSVKVSSEGWGESGASTAVIANGYSFPDAMAGVPLAGMMDAPVLLTAGETPEAALLEQLRQLGVEKTVLLGGTGRISDAFAQQLESEGIAVERISGSDRYATSAAVAQRMLELGAQPECVFITCGSNFPDALSVSPAAGVLGCPILYANDDGSFSPETAEAIRSSGVSSVIIAGGSAAVPEEVKDALAAAGVNSSHRLSGADRYQTSLAVNRYFISVFSGSGLCLASGEDFPDALSGGAFAVKLKAPVMLISSRKNVDGAYGYFAVRKPESVYIIGGEGAVSSYAADTFMQGGTITTARPTTTTAPKTTARTTAAAKEKITSAGGTVNIRSGPGTSYKKLGSITPGKYLDVLGSEKAADGQKWYRVSFNGGEGCVMASLVTTGKPDDSKPSGGKKAYLTFDDGPSANTKKILNILDQHNVKATFFVIYRSGYESVYKDIVKRGHTLALHSYSHDYSSIYRSTSAYFKDLNRLSDYVYKTTGVRSKILRFPGGGSNTVSRSYCRGIMTTLTKEVQNRGYRYYDWNVDSGDAGGNLSASAILSNVKRSCGSQKNAIVLMHDAPGKKTTVTALPDIIRYLKGKGYELLPITESTPQVHHKVNN